MSASEKLKALEMPDTADDAEFTVMGGYDLLRVRDALPQIVAVVEAAEAAGDYIIGSKFSMEQPFVSERIRDVRASLSALDEALT